MSHTRIQAQQHEPKQHSPTSPSHNKSPTAPPTSSSSTQLGTVPPFRNVSACNRCRLRKHRCDQRLPRCEACSKAQVRCVGYDPLTKQEVPRSYVAFLETRVGYLEQILVKHGIGFKAAAAYDEGETLGIERMGSSEVRGRIARKRKLVQLEDGNDVPTRQMKRLAQVNVLLAEIVNEGCLHRGCEGSSGRGHTRRKRNGSLEGRVPWSPRSLDSVERSGGFESPESESSVSSRELYRFAQQRRGNEMSLLGARSILEEDYERKAGPGVDIGVVNFESEIPDTKHLSGKTGKSLNVASHASPGKKEDCSEPEAEVEFDIAADLLRGRRERERGQQRGRYDLLDEFLVDWAD
jgi:hypothetical protein